MAITFQRRFSHNFGFDVAYTGSVTKGNGEQFGGTTIPDDIGFDYGYAANHTPHRLVANSVWDMAWLVAAPSRLADLGNLRVSVGTDG